MMALLFWSCGGSISLTWSPAAPHVADLKDDDDIETVTA
jgi:hypothetical protein